MDCCNRQRQAQLKTGQTQNARQRRTIGIEYVGTKRLTFFSPSSMRSYTFAPSSKQRVHRVTPEDAASLLRRKDFRKLG